ncbi:ImmA/IrrE family metallo-endopeptidase [Microbacterium sp. NPDC090007]|uniref:ImmA/IrrE family metallo-endopeptidase n=1 Tax=Microbacterium sp. NPDC090007 TaxID=3364204 RepID=UPI00381F4BA3
MAGARRNPSSAWTQPPGRSRSSASPDHAAPDDCQRLTVRHEVGHLVLHVGRPQPVRPTRREKRTKLAGFASAFLAPGDAVIIDHADARVSLTALTRLKERLGCPIKAFSTRFRQLGVIDDDHARSRQGRSLHGGGASKSPSTFTRRRVVNEVSSNLTARATAKAVGRALGTSETNEADRPAVVVGTTRHA